MGFDGNDRLTGSGGEDRLYGGDGNDELIGGTVNDDGVVGDDGVSDMLVGGNGLDTYKISVEHNSDFGDTSSWVWRPNADYSSYSLNETVLEQIDYIEDSDAQGTVEFSLDGGDGFFAGQSFSLDLRSNNMTVLETGWAGADVTYSFPVTGFGMGLLGATLVGSDLVIHELGTWAYFNAFFAIKDFTNGDSGFREHKNSIDAPEDGGDVEGDDDNNNIIGSNGDDTAFGGEGSDTYSDFGKSGTDVVRDVGSAADVDAVDLSQTSSSEITISRGVASASQAQARSFARTSTSSDADSNDLIIRGVSGSEQTGTLILKDYFGGRETGIEQIILSDMTLEVSDVLELLNTAPEVSNEVADQTATEGEEWSFTIPADTFSDADGGALTYTASLADGSTLPDWLSFDAVTRTFTGTPPEGFEGDLSLTVTASDEFTSASDTFEVVIDAAADTLGENLVTNGSFEDHGALSRGGWGTFETLSGWTSPVGVIEVQERNYGTGNRQDNAVIELDAHANSTIATTVSVDAAGEYILSLDYAMRGSDVASNGFTVSVDGVEVAQVSPSVFGFKQLELKLDLSEGDHTIELAGAGRSNSYGTVVDNVVLMKNDTFTLGENLISNGSFEDHGALNRGGWGTFESLDGWISPEGVIEVQERNYGTGNENGNAVVELDAHRNSLIQQTVEVSESGPYQLYFDYAMRGSNIHTNGVAVLLDGEVVRQINPTAQGFTQSDIVLELEAGSHTIAFAAIGRSDSYGTVIDNVALHQMEEVNGDGEAIEGRDAFIESVAQDSGLSGNALAYNFARNIAGDQFAFADTDAIANRTDGPVGQSVTGSNGDDLISGGTGDDLLLGGSGSDVFLFRSNDIGHDTVSDFVVGEGSDDVLSFDSSVFANFAAVLAATTQSGDDSVIRIDDENSITLQNVTATQLHQDDFLFL